MKMKCMLAALAALVSSAVSAAVADNSVSTFDHVDYWVGSGTNRAVVIVDYNDAQALSATSFAWGFRWNGDGPSLKAAFDALAADDPRFTSLISASGWVTGFPYDADNDPETPALDPRSDYDFSEDYEWMIGHDWSAATATNSADFGELEWTKNEAVATGVFLQDGGWYSQKFAYYSMSVVDWSYGDDTETFVPSTPVNARRGLHFPDVLSWTGTGTNETVMVVDFNDGSVEHCAFAWGYRWNGAAPTVEQMMAEVAAADPRLTFTISQGSWGGFLKQIAYDDDGDPATDPLEGAVEDYYDADADYFYSMGTSWMLLAGDGAEFPRAGVAETPNGMSTQTVQHGGWLCWRICTYSSVSTNPDWEFVSYDVDTTSFYDPVAAEPAARPDVVSFGDVQAWVGTGAHETVLVVDFNDGSVDACSFAWGYRWDGDAPTVETVMNEIAAADPRLTVVISQGAWGGFLEQIAYDHDNNPHTPDLVGAVEDYYDMDADYFYSMGTSWMLLVGEGETFPRDEVAEAPNGMSIQAVQDGGWLCWRICTYVSTSALPDYSFVDYYVDTTSFYDPVSAWTFPVAAPLVAPTVESISVTADVVTVVPGNVVDGLFYGLAAATTPAGPFAPPTSWVRAENGSAVLTAPKSGDAAFFKVVVTASPAQ